MIKKNGNKFTKEYKEFIKKINDEQGFEIAYSTVALEFTNIQRTTIKKWVDKSFNTNKQQISQKSYKKWKNNHPEGYKRQSLNRKEQQRLKLKEDEEFKQRQYKRTCEWRNKNKDYHKNYSEEYWKLNKEDQLKKRQIKRQTDLSFRILENTRAYLYHLMKKACKLKKVVKKETTLSLIGCSKEFLLNYLRSKYQLGMTDENYGKWHIDHIKPCALFDLTDPEERKKCFHYTNLQPLWAIDNLLKSDHYTE
jgi:hypothetical protein